MKGFLQPRLQSPLREGKAGGALGCSPEAARTFQGLPPRLAPVVTHIIFNIVE